jgi:sugar lactone lactonase YvrE
MPPFETLISGLAFPESPRWRDSRLLFSDQHANRVVAVDQDGTIETLARVPGKPSGLGFLPDGSLLIVSMRDRRILRRALDGSLAEYADLSHLAHWPLNDMLVDYDGRAWVGNFGFDLAGRAPACTTSLICVEQDSSPRVAANDLGFPNGMVLTPNGGTLIVAETLMNRLSAFPVDSGNLGERRTWAAFGPPPASRDVHSILKEINVAPDEICLDAEGVVWVADVAHGRIIRVAEGGQILDEISTGEDLAFACMLGGEDGCTLFACVAPTFDEVEASTYLRGSILTARINVPHAGLP